MWRVYVDVGSHDTCCITGLWSTQAKVEVILQRAAWHWGRDSNVINDPLGNQPHPIVCRPSVYLGLLRL